MIPKNWWSSIHLADATGNLPVLFALFVHAGDFVQQINGNVWRLPMLHVSVTTDEEPRRTKLCIKSKAEGLKIAKIQWMELPRDGQRIRKNRWRGENKSSTWFDRRHMRWNSKLRTSGKWQCFFLLEMKLWFFSMYFVGWMFENSAFGSTHVLFVLGICLLLASRSMVHLVSTKRGAETERGERISATHNYKTIW